MMIVIVHPERFNIEEFECKDLAEAAQHAGLPPDQLEHAIVGPGIGIAVYEHAFWEKPERQHYFAVNARLFAGRAVMYGVNRDGEQDELMDCPNLLFFKDCSDIEAAIQRRVVQRPRLMMYNTVVWEWPSRREKLQ